LCVFGTWRLRCIRRDEPRIAGEAILGKPDVALSDKESGLCLAVATATRPAGPLTDIANPQAAILHCSLESLQTGMTQPTYCNMGKAALQLR
jgi:hypothetical protein